MGRCSEGKGGRGREMRERDSEMMVGEAVEVERWNSKEEIERREEEEEGEKKRKEKKKKRK